MKKLLSLALALTMALTLAACGGTPSGENTGAPAETTPVESPAETQPAPVGPIVNGASSGRFEADGTTRAPIEAGGALTVEGSRIKLVGDSPQVGVTLTSVSDPEVSYFIPPTAMLINEPKRLMFVLPKEVTDGSWQVTVTTQYSHAKQTVKKPRSFTMDMPFTIGEATEPGGGEEEGGGGSMG